MKILVLGSKGFIGSNIHSFFRKKGYDVWGADVVTDYVDSRHFLIDATDPDFSHVFTKNSFDVCINCAGAASVPASLENPLRDFNLNVTIVAKILNAIKTFSPACRLIQLSSAAVYGSPVNLPINEKAATHPLSPYGIHKQMAEELCSEFSLLFGLQTSCLRIFSAYGPGLKKQIFWDLHQKSFNSDKVALHGTGKESRDFIYIEDLASLIECVIEKGKFQAEIINAASGNETYIEDAVTLFYKTSAWKGTFQFSGVARKGDPLNWQADISLASSHGFKPRFSLQEGLQRYYQWLKSEKSA